MLNVNIVGFFFGEGCCHRIGDKGWLGKREKEKLAESYVYKQSRGHLQG